MNDEFRCQNNGVCSLCGFKEAAVKAKGTSSKPGARYAKVGSAQSTHESRGQIQNLEAAAAVTTTYTATVHRCAVWFSITTQACRVVPEAHSTLIQ
jgi:hypothetical protein